MRSPDWYWDIDRQVAVRVDNAGRHDLLIGPYASQSEAEVWMPSTAWKTRTSQPGHDDWIDVNSAYD